MAAARRKASELSCDDVSIQLYTLVNGVTSVVGGKVSLQDLPLLDALLETKEMYMDDFINS